MTFVTQIQPKTGTGTRQGRVPVPYFFWPAFGVLLLCQAFALPLDTNFALVLAASLMLVGGLPHGAFDIALASRALRLNRAAAWRLFGAYILVASMMLLIWALAPIAALSLFLGLAALHFGEDWRMLDAGLLRMMAGASIICIPAFAHPEAVALLFVTMAGENADWVCRIATALTPVAVLVTAVGMWQAVQAGDSGWALAQCAALACLALFPPQIGFVLYFVFLHSPLHMRGLARMLPGWSIPRLWAYGAFICLSCVAVAALLAPGLFSGQSAAMSADAFRLLSVVAAPHLLLTLFVESRTAPLGGSALNHSAVQP
jgi:beta-carotene 15,15'-dioxygenase